MFSISKNNIITMSRGDSAVTSFRINLGTGVAPDYYDLTEDDKVYFGVMEPNIKFEQSVIRKVMTSLDYDESAHAVTVTFDCKDTERLIPGTYYYMIKLYRPTYDEDGSIIEEKVDTVLSKTKFIIID